MATLYSLNSRLVKQVTEDISPEPVELVELRDPVTGSLFYDRLPKSADVVVTMAELNKEIELYAMRLGAMVIVLPEGGDYLAEHVADGRWSVLVGADLKNPK